VTWVAWSGHDDQVFSVSAVALDSLRGLALGDGFGKRWFHRGNREAIEMIKARQLPSELPWHWTDDTAMALTIVHMLHLQRPADPGQRYRAVRVVERRPSSR